ncbi:trigger factor [Azospirillaceae bacterium]
MAVSFGQENLEKLKSSIRDRVRQDYDGLSRTRLKRALLDKLSEIHTFPTPPTMVEIEFDSIWKRRQADIDGGQIDKDEVGRSEDDLKAEYRSIAERRVRLGLLLAEVGRRNNIAVTDEELKKAIVAEARRYPGYEHKVLEIFNNHPESADRLRAPLFEEKTVNFILELVKTTERQVSIEELSREADDEGNASKETA